MMVAVEMDNKQLRSKHAVVIRQVVEISNRNNSACRWIEKISISLIPF